MSHYPPKSFTERDREIAEQLADPAVDEAWAREWIAARTREVQAMWSAQERRSRCAWALGPPYEVPTIGGGVLRKGVRTVSAG
jgi:hypothetical protein